MSAHSRGVAGARVEKVLGRAEGGSWWAEFRQRAQVASFSFSVFFFFFSSSPFQFLIFKFILNFKLVSSLFSVYNVTLKVLNFGNIYKFPLHLYSFSFPSPFPHLKLELRFLHKICAQINYSI